MLEKPAVRTPLARHRIDTVSVVGIAAGLVVLGGAVLVWFEDPRTGLVVASVAILIVVAHVLLRWYELGWALAQAGWTALIVIGIVTLRSEWPLAAAAGLAAFAGLAYVQWVARSLEEHPDPMRFVSSPGRVASGSCEECSERVTHAVAPQWCVSFIFMSSVTIGRPRYLCPAHARMNAIPATLFSLAFGWWGFPWGLWYTPKTIWRNLAAGGVIVDANLADELHRREQSGTAGWFNFLPGVRSKPIAVLGFLLFMMLVFGSVWIAIQS